jgi:hypothetical protein
VSFPHAKLAPLKGVGGSASAMQVHQRHSVANKRSALASLWLTQSFEHPPRTADLFGVEFELPILTKNELYAGKLVAALDRQHPRDLFDVWQLYESGGLTDGMTECFVVYLAGHNRPIHEVLFSRDKDMTAEYDSSFVGMTETPCSLATLLETRARLKQELPTRLTESHREFLVGLARAQPDWSLLQCPHAAELPALRWKLRNLEIFSKRRPSDFISQAEMLEAGLESQP